MNRLRAFFLRHQRLALLLVAAALCMKAVIPAGYMLDSAPGMLTVQICTGSASQIITTHITVAHSSHTPDSEKGKVDHLCPFTALGHAVLGGADPIQIALELLFVMALAFAPRLPATPKRIRHLRPPLRGPPALA